MRKNTRKKECIPPLLSAPTRTNTTTPCLVWLQQTDTKICDTATSIGKWSSYQNYHLDPKGPCELIFWKSHNLGSDWEGIWGHEFEVLWKVFAFSIPVSVDCHAYQSEIQRNSCNHHFSYFPSLIVWRPFQTRWITWCLQTFLSRSKHPCEGFHANPLTALWSTLAWLWLKGTNSWWFITCHQIKTFRTQNSNAQCKTDLQRTMVQKLVN